MEENTKPILLLFDQRVRMVVIQINPYEDDYYEDPYDLDERNFDSHYKCSFCGSRLKKGKEEDDAYGTKITYDVWYCPECQ